MKIFWVKMKDNGQDPTKKKEAYYREKVMRGLREPNATQRDTVGMVQVLKDIVDILRLMDHH